MASTEVWSGSTSDGTFSGTSCGAWNDNSSVGDYGDATSAGSSWLRLAFQGCSNTARLYGISPAITLFPGDADLNGLVSLTDFVIWADHYGEMVGAVGTTVDNPEPSSLTLLALGTLGVLGYGWRRRKRVA